MKKYTDAVQQPVRYYSAVIERNIDWLWYPYIPFGKITVVQGDPGDGKTTFILNIAALLSKGLPMPESSAAISGTAIYQSAEDSMEDTIKPRLLCAGADCTKIALNDDAECGLTVNDARLEGAIMENGARLLVRSVLLVGRIGSGSSIRAMAQIKNSLSGEGTPIAFEILDNAAARWIGHYDITVDELLNGSGPPQDESEVNQAAEKLKGLMAHDAVPCKQIDKMLSKLDIGKRSVDKAKKVLGIWSIKRADGWYWSL